MAIPIAARTELTGQAKRLRQYGYCMHTRAIDLIQPDQICTLADLAAYHEQRLGYPSSPIPTVVVPRFNLALLSPLFERLWRRNAPVMRHLLVLVAGEEYWVTTHFESPEVARRLHEAALANAENQLENEFASALGLVAEAQARNHARWVADGQCYYRPVSDQQDNWE